MYPYKVYRRFIVNNYTEKYKKMRKIYLALMMTTHWKWIRVEMDRSMLHFIAYITCIVKSRDTRR